MMHVKIVVSPDQCGECFCETCRFSGGVADLAAACHSTHQFKYAAAFSKISLKLLFTSDSNASSTGNGLMCV